MRWRVVGEKSHFTHCSAAGGALWAVNGKAAGVSLAAMSLSRVTLGKIALAWAIFLWCAGMLLPNLDSHTRAHPVVKAIIAVVYTLFLIGTPIGLATYFNRAWRRVATVPNRTAYVIWINLESIAGAGLLGILAYATVSLTIACLR